MFSTCRVKKNLRFYEPQFRRISLNISLSDSVLETKALQAKKWRIQYADLLMIFWLWKFQKRYINIKHVMASCAIWHFWVLKGFKYCNAGITPLRIITDSKLRILNFKRRFLNCFTSQVKSYEFLKCKENYNSQVICSEVLKVRQAVLGGLDASWINASDHSLHTSSQEVPVSGFCPIKECKQN